MATKKKVKHLQVTKNVYLPNKNRSHPFYFIGLPLTVALFFTFFWIVLVPVTYYIFSVNIDGFQAFSVYFFVAMFAIFLLIMSLFVCQWRCKPSNEKTDIYFVKYEFPEPPEVTEIEKPTRLQDNIVFREKFVNELKSKQRPRPIIIEERPASENPESSLTPRQKFFINMYEYSHHAACNASRKFLEKERLFYSKTGSVYRPHSHTLNDSQELQCVQDEQYPQELYFQEEQYPQEISSQEEQPFIQEFSSRNRPRCSNTTDPYATVTKPRFKPKDTEYFIANVVQRQHCVSEAFMFVEEHKPDLVPITVIIELNDCKVTF